MKAFGVVGRTTVAGVAGVTAPLLPLWASVSALSPRLRADWRERWGLAVSPVQPDSIWIVASSVGEVRLGARLANRLQSAVFLTADTDTGAAVARSLHRFAGRKPVDHPWTLAPLWAEARPRCIVWVEGAFWPGLASLARRDGVPTARIGARPGRGADWTHRFGHTPDLLIARDETAARWFRSRGVSVWGVADFKQAPKPGPNLLRWSGPFAVAGCTHRGDERRALEAQPDWRWLLAPRHLERCGEVGEWLTRRGLAWSLYSELRGTVPDETQVVLLDSLGVLPQLYRGARVALIGGSFDPQIGAHSPWEALAAEVPVVVGPHHLTQGEVVQHPAVRPTEASTLASDLQQACGLQVHLAPDAQLEAAAARIDDLGSAPSLQPSPRPWARPLAVAFGAGSRAWHASWDWGLRRPVQVGVPVVSIGTVNARGPGKTATVRWWVEALRRRGHRPGVATRGYGRAASGLKVSWRVETAAALGDEGACLAASGFPVAACLDRVRAAQALMSHGVTVVVLDDGFQHRRLHRDLDLVVVDARYPDGRGLLPAGEAREPGVPARADGVVVHHGEWSTDRLPVVTARRHPGPWYRDGCLDDLPDGPVVAFAGIGRPVDFLAGLLRPVHYFESLPDHAPLKAAWMESLASKGPGLPIVCTDKDAVRLPQSWRSRVWYRGIDVELEGVPEAWFQRVAHVVG